ncbi:MAG: hypothetical protein ACRELY_06410 [Polyangiaceae bacterium]
MKDLAGIAERWTAYEEMNGGDSAHLAEVLADLRELAQLARKEKKSLLLSTSL